MIYQWFLAHQWREMMRASIWQKNVALNIILGLLIGILLLYLLLIGIFIDAILLDLYPASDPVKIFNGFLLYYFGIEFFIRFFMQSLPTLNIETYLHLPVRKSAIVHFVAGKSIFVIGNYLSWLVVIPFAVKVLVPASGLQAAFFWLVSFVLLVFTNNFLATYVKRQLVGRPSVIAAVGMIFIIVALLDHFDVVSVTALSADVFGRMTETPLLVLIPVVFVVASYGLNYYHLRTHLYPEEVSRKKMEQMDTLSEIRYLKSLGLTGQMISLDLRLIWRHKRPRSIIYMAPLFLGYGLIFYPQPEYQNQPGFLIFVGIFMTGGMMLNYTNYCFGYESNYFDNILANYQDLERYLRAKYIFAVAIATFCYVITLPYVFFGPEIVLINSVTYLYNIGFLSYVLLYFATYTTKRMDLSRGAAFNYQGLGATHWLSMLPAFLLPVIIYLPFSYLGYPTAGLLFIGAIGLLGLLFYRTATGLIYRQFMKKRYAMAEGFRE